MTDLPSIHDPAVAADQPHAMRNDAGDMFYPDDPDDAAQFAEHHDAVYVHPNGGDWS